LLTAELSIGRFAPTSKEGQIDVRLRGVPLTNYGIPFVGRAEIPTLF
jgi:hypothetical protein